MNAIDRKLVRDLGRLKGQVITIALVVGCGIASFVSMQSTFSSLEGSQTTFYERSRFSEVFAHVGRAPEPVRDQLEAVPGVAEVETRIVETAKIPIGDGDESALAQLVSLPDGEQPRQNRLFLRRGRLVEAGRSDEAVVLEAFANAHDLGPGDPLDIVINGRLRTLKIVGTGVSPEYVMSVPAGEFAPDDRRFAVLWMDRATIAPSFQLEGSFNDVVLRLQPGTDVEQVLDRVERLLEPYGTISVLPRAKQPSHFFVAQELEQLSGMATVVPVIFLAVAAFLLNVVLARLVHLQRPQIAALKALGYDDLQIGLHYLKLVSLVVLVGSAIGVGLGAYLGDAMTELYTQYFRFPTLDYHLETRVVLISVLVSLAAAVIGALGSVRSISRLPPAEAMRPPAPALYQRSIFEILGIHRMLGTAARMVFREIERRPLRTLLSSLGIAAAIAILVVGRFSYDAIERLFDVYFHESLRDDYSVVFAKPIPARELSAIASLPGVEYAEGMRAAAVRFHNGHRARDAVVLGHPEDSELRHLLDRDGKRQPIPADGIAITNKLAEILDLRVGDRIEVEIREGQRGRRELGIAALVDEPFGLQGHMRIDRLNRFLREEGTVSMALLRVDPLLAEDTARRLNAMPMVVAVTRKTAFRDRFEEQSGSMMMVMTLIMTLFASTIAIGVVYNNARISLSMRSRDLASLRVLGFTRGEISSILLGEMAVQVLLAIPMGLALGTWWSHSINSMVDPELYRFPIVISERTYAFAVVVALGSAVVSALLVRRKLDRLDLIGVLKTRE